MRSRFAVVLLAMGLSSCTVSGGTGSEGIHHPSYIAEDCPVDVSISLVNDVSCGTLSVPLRHDDPDGKTIKLLVARIEPGIGQPSADPVLSLGGDLGVAPDYKTIDSQAAGLGREVIVMDVRGTGHSTPSLVCPEVDALEHSVVDVPVDDSRTRREFLGAVTACHDRLVSQGVDLSAFDLHEMAADAEDLRVALRIDSWNVMALGTSSRIAVEYLRDFPDHARATVLDSPEWPGVDPFVESVEATRYATQQQVADCAADAVCDRIAPHLAQDIEALDRRLATHPFVVDLDDRGRVVFDAGWFQVWLRARLSFQRMPGSFVPHAIALLANRSDRANEEQMAFRIVSQQLCQGFLPNCWTQLVRSLGVYFSVMCRDVLPFTGGTPLEGLAAGTRGLVEAYAHSPYLDACKAWDVPPSNPVVAAPVSSDVPTLIVVGRFDPFGMLPYAEDAMSTLSHSDLLVSPVNGHQVTGTEEPSSFCMVRIRDAWLADPAGELDSSCMRDLHLDYGMPRPPPQ